jgi:pyruvate dehydrogenase E2 component (dihydrolipoamide acetyltransferase)
MIEIAMPQLTEAMEDGTILTWLIAEGDAVAVGDELVEIETDKATTTHPAEQEGILEIVVPEGETVIVGTPIARLREPGEATQDGDAGDVGERRPVTGPHADAAEAHTGEDELPVAPGAAPEERPAAPATPLARRIAAIHGVGLADVSGSGPRGRVTKGDVLAAAGVEPGGHPNGAGDAPAAATPRAADAAPAAKGEIRLVEPTRSQSVVARRMAESKATIPEFGVEAEVVMDAAAGLRVDLGELDGERPVPSFNDMVVKASALALAEHPLANGSYRDGRFELHERVNVGIAVAADRSLVVPTITDADSRSLTSIAAESRRLAARVRDGEITPPELAGATFTVSNLGMFGMSAITPVINPPQAAILGVGAIRQVLARDESGAVIDRSLLTLRLTCDHRILYGADAALFLSRIRDLLERPLSLLS